MNVQAAQMEAPVALHETRYLKNCWYAAWWSSDLPAGEIKARTILNQPLAFFRSADGVAHAIADRCSHRLAPLSMGKLLANGHLRCCYHGLEFDKDGHCVVNPHTPGVTPNARLDIPSYPLVEKHGMVWVWLGEAKPDVTLVPDYKCFDGADERHMSKRDYLRLEAETSLVVDNLLDLSHIAFLHDGVLGDSAKANADIKVENAGDAITVSRFNTDATIPGIFAEFWPDPPKLVDKGTAIRWTAPSNLLNDTGVWRQGTDRSTGTGFYGAHILTPETDETTHYFFAAVRWNVRTQGEIDLRIQKNLNEMRRFAFEKQDAPVIEAQQRRMKAPSAPKPLFLSIDVGPVQYRRILERMLRAEEAPDQG
ncbi:MAG TPA: aromatic ring-hydroxylating dioxygenase subunit alpha [Beijerinckiaceae bacterium]|jgi:vanillate O-demethylase monooxygenase subunit|nr:aromatic ring-hydroxylating dioxygenase subunit alpha [Beijerinckiaceae bacterium]